jgi:competence protein ComEC
LALLSSFGVSRFSREELTFIAFDAGQADSFLFHFPGGENVLIDAGARNSGGELVSKLRALGVKKIDILVATHPHEDHIGGMSRVIESFSIGKVWDSGFEYASPARLEMLRAVRAGDIPFGRPRTGFIERIGEAEIAVLAPVSPIKGTESDANNNSLVLHISYGKISFLMTGDIEAAGRARVAKFPRSTVLKVSHHGSANGTDERLLEETRPSIAILSYGMNNSYGHPHSFVTELLERHGAESYSTKDGDITITTDGKVYSVIQ